MKPPIVFDSFKRLLLLCFTHAIYSEVLIASAIALAIFTGQDNIFTVPEFYPASKGDTPLPIDGKNWAHVGAHIVFGGASSCHSPRGSSRRWCSWSGVGSNAARRSPVGRVFTRRW